MMKIETARKAYAAQLDALRYQKQALTKQLKDSENAPAGNFDRVEISKELASVEAQYEATQEGLEDIIARQTAIHNSEAAKQQAEVMSEAAEDFLKIMEIYRRIASGGKVPSKDERKLMEYSSELYMAAKSAALVAQGEGEEYDSLWKDEEEKTEDRVAPSEIAAQTDIDVPTPDVVAAQAAAEVSQRE